MALAVTAKRRKRRACITSYFASSKKSLGQLDKWLDAAAAFATQRSLDPNVFVGLRLASDQFTLARQVQATCDTAMLAASRLTGKEATAHPDTETTLAELQARIRSVAAYPDSLSTSDFAQARAGGDRAALGRQSDERRRLLP